MKFHSGIYKSKQGSCYDNTFKNILLTKIKSICLLVFSLGLAYPFVICLNERSICSHTIINGKRLKFIGNPKELLKNWIFWWALSLLTLGIAGIIVKIRFKRWAVSNTVFDDK